MAAGAVALLGAAGPAVVCAEETPVSAPGQYDIGVSTRTFDSPLFGSDRATTYRFFGRQSFSESGNYQVWLNGGISDYRTHYGIEGNGIVAGNQILGFGAGDFSFDPLTPDKTARGFSDSYALRGASLGGTADGFSWRTFAGKTVYDVGLPSGQEERPTLFGAQSLWTLGRNAVGVDMIVVEDAPFADETRNGNRDLVLTSRYFRQLSPWISLFGEASGASEGFGARVGTGVRMLRGEVSGSIYSFGDGLPYVYPLFRPGEQGLEVRGRYQVTGWASVYGTAYYSTDDAIREREELRGSASMSMSFGDSWPTISLDYSHDDVVYRTLDPDVSGTLADRLAVTLSRPENHGYTGLTVEHSRSTRGNDLDRSQALFVYRRALTPRSTLDGSAVLQRDEDSNFGGTVEAALERPLRGAYSYLVGLGTGYIDRAAEETGEGVLRLGLSRRIRGSGWYARVEARVPFEVGGLERSDLNRQVLAVDVGNRFSWDDLSGLSSAFGRNADRRGTGSIEGMVYRQDAGRGGIGVLVDGEPRGVTRRDGSFTVRGVKAGEVFVSLDLRGLEPGYEVDGEWTRTIHVSPGIASHMDFTVARFSSFQGALVRCEGDRLVALKNVAVTLAGDGFTKTVVTSSVGGFQLDRVPPGLYELTVDPEVAGDFFPPLRVDLAEEIFGYVIKLDCSDSPGDPDDRILPLSNGE